MDRIEEKYKTIASYLPVGGLLLLLASMPFHYGSLQRVALYWIGLCYPIDIIVNKRWKGWRWDYQKWTYAGFILFFSLIPIWQCFDPLKSGLYGFTIDRYMPFLIIGVCGIVGMSDKFRIEYSAGTMLLTSAAIVGYLLFRTSVVEGEGIAEWTMRFNALRAEEINTHMTVNMYLNLTVVMALYTILQGKVAKAWKYGTAVAMVPVVFALLITEGRTGLLTLFGIVAGCLLYYVYRRRKWWLLVGMLGVLVVMGLYLMQRDRFVMAVTEVNPRIYIWNVACDQIRDNAIWGQGVCSAREDFVERGLADEAFWNNYAIHFKCLEEEKHGVANMGLMHPHNAVLETWTQFGIIGVLLLLWVWIGPLTMRLGREKLYMEMCVFVFVMQACFESMGNNLPPMFLCLMVILIDYHHRYKWQMEEKEKLCKV